MLITLTKGDEMANSKFVEFVESFVAAAEAGSSAKLTVIFADGRWQVDYNSYDTFAQSSSRSGKDLNRVIAKVWADLS